MAYFVGFCVYKGYNSFIIEHGNLSLYINGRTSMLTEQVSYKTSKRLMTIVPACFFLSGITGLVYELLWTRLIVKMVGGASFAVSIILTIFMGGLGLQLVNSAVITVIILVKQKVFKPTPFLAPVGLGVLLCIFFPSGTGARFQ